MDLQEIVKSALKGNAIGKISDATGIDSSTVTKVVSAGAPLILGQMANNTETEDGAEKLNKAVETKHSESLLDNISSIFTGGSENTDGAKILGHVFGNNSDAADSIAKKTKVDPSSVVQILSFVAPLIMAALAKKKAKDSLNAGGLSDLLKSQKTPKGNSLGNIAKDYIDKNDDGSIVDDLIGMFGK